MDPKVGLVGLLNGSMASGIHDLVQAKRNDFHFSTLVVQTNLSRIYYFSHNTWRDSQTVARLIGGS